MRFIRKAGPAEERDTSTRMAGAVRTPERTLGEAGSVTETETGRRRVEAGASIGWMIPD